MAGRILSLTWCMDAQARKTNVRNKEEEWIVYLLSRQNL